MRVLGGAGMCCAFIDAGLCAAASAELSLTAAACCPLPRTSCDEARFVVLLRSGVLVLGSGLLRRDTAFLSPLRWRRGLCWLVR